MLIAGNSFEVNGAITGPGSITLSNNFVALNGSDSYQGATTVLQGILSIANANALPGTTALTIESGAEVSLNTDIAIGSLAGSGTIVTGGANTITTGEDDTDTTFSGTISAPFGVPGPSRLTKVGFGTFTFSGTGQYTGTTTVNEGALVVDGTLDGIVAVGSSSELEGTGTIGGMDASGDVFPGDPGRSGIFSSVGSTILEQGSILFVELNGTVPGSGFSQMASNSVDLSGSPTLYPILGQGFTPAIVANFTILTANSINGTFQGLPDGALFSAYGRPFTIHYTATAVVLTAVNYPAPVITGFSPVEEGDPAGILTITGTGFVPSTSIELDGSYVADYYISDTELEVPVPPFPEVGTHTVTATNPSPGGGTTTQTLVVADAPLTGAGVNVSGTEQATLTGMVATFSDPAPQPADSYTAFIDWGDGNTTLGTVKPYLGNFMVIGSHRYLQQGSYTVATTILDEGGASVTVQSTANVAFNPLAATGMLTAAASSGVDTVPSPVSATR